MATTEKISVAMGREELRLAKRAAEEEGLSLSAFVTSAVRARIAEKRRHEAARQVLATFDPEDWPTPEAEAELLALWSAPRPKPASRRVTRGSPQGGPSAQGQRALASSRALRSIGLGSRKRR